MPAPLFPEKSPNMLRNLFKQISLPFSPGIVKLLLLCCPCESCCLFEDGDPDITQPLGRLTVESVDF